MKALEGEPLEKTQFLDEMRKTVQNYLAGVSDYVQKEIEFCLEIDTIPVVPVLKNIVKKKQKLLFLQKV